MVMLILIFGIQVRHIFGQKTLALDGQVELDYLMVLVDSRLDL